MSDAFKRCSLSVPLKVCIDKNTKELKALFSFKASFWEKPCSQSLLYDLGKVSWVASNYPTVKVKWFRFLLTLLGAPTPIPHDGDLLQPAKDVVEKLELSFISN